MRSSPGCGVGGRRLGLGAQHPQQRAQLVERGSRRLADGVERLGGRACRGPPTRSPRPPPPAPRSCSRGGRPRRASRGRGGRARPAVRRAARAVAAPPPAPPTPPPRAGTPRGGAAGRRAVGRAGARPRRPTRRLHRNRLRSASTVGRRSPTPPTRRAPCAGLQHSKTAARPNTTPSGTSGSGHSAAPYQATASPVMIHTGIGPAGATRAARSAGRARHAEAVRLGSLACAPTSAAPVTTKTNVPAAITTSAVAHLGDADDRRARAPPNATDATRAGHPPAGDLSSPAAATRRSPARAATAYPSSVPSNAWRLPPRRFVGRSRPPGCASGSGGRDRGRRARSRLAARAPWRMGRGHGPLGLRQEHPAARAGWSAHARRRRGLGRRPPPLVVLGQPYVPGCGGTTSATSSSTTTSSPSSTSRRTSNCRSCSPASRAAGPRPRCARRSIAWGARLRWRVARRSLWRTATARGHRPRPRHRARRPARRRTDRRARSGVWLARRRRLACGAGRRAGDRDGDPRPADRGAATCQVAMRDGRMVQPDTARERAELGSTAR